MIFSIITIFTMTTIILVMSVVHVEMNKSNVGYQELICQETDMDCFKLLCPQGWGWVKEKEQCAILDEHVFPPDCSFSIPEVKSTGVVTSGYKEMCHSDYVWVNWRKKCLRRN